MTKKNNAVELAEFKKDIHYIKKAVDRGFAGVHKRQDVSNGRVAKNEDDIIILKEHQNDYVTKESYNQNIIGKTAKIKWYIIGVGGTVFIQLVIIYLPKAFGG